ncbi:MAG: putative nucleic acid-binding Zn ribbon protein [Verrucomicrobiales bacterium]|jgi:predicted nucleic acid-binding Zn ribbon protein
MICSSLGLKSCFNVSTCQAGASVIQKARECVLEPLQIPGLFLGLASFLSMTTYIYETIPENADEETRRFEVQQNMSDPALKTDPETGLPVKRVITGGSGVVFHGTSILSMNTKGSRGK